MKRKNRLRTLLIRDEKLRDAMELYPGKTREEVREILCKELKKRILPGGALAIVFLALAVLGKRTEETDIIRPNPGEAPIGVQVLLELESGWIRMPLTIGALEYEEDKIEEMHCLTEAYLDKVVLGKNEVFEKVIHELYFPEQLPELCNDIYWKTDAPWLVTAEGTVLNDELMKEVPVQITAEISYGSEQRNYSRLITVCPAEYTEEEAIFRAVQAELLNKEENSRTERKVELPEMVQGYRIRQEEEKGMSVNVFLILLAFVIPLLLYEGFFGSLDTRRKQRKELAENCYTEFITKLSILLAAGISLRKAFARMAEEYEKKNGPNHVLAAELKVTKQELDNGHSESIVYEEFGRRIGVLAYRRMASLLTQSVSRGVQGMRGLLLQEAKEVMAQDKANIRMRGEQAGTKLLFPMMGLLFLVFAILLVPAFQSF